ncbi:MAG: sugar transferase [Bacteroidales bacterium]|nr:MAG: sugar transferase [Bacteroidales bacterium]
MYKSYFKRIADYISIIILLVPAIILFCIVILLFVLFDRLPVFYCAKRLGKNGVPFTMYKLRTMIVNAPDIRLPDGSTYNSDDDPRLTKVGKLFRKTSIDELPQLYNILKGDMSFIGPRPDPLDWLDKYSDEERIFLSVRPGITGYNQAYFRNLADGKAKILNDVFYAKNISFKLDMKILFKTIKTVTLRENINVEKERI